MERVRPVRLTDTYSTSRLVSSQKADARCRRAGPGGPRRNMSCPSKSYTETEGSRRGSQREPATLFASTTKTRKRKKKRGV